MEEKQVWQE